MAYCLRRKTLRAHLYSVYLYTIQCFFLMECITHSLLSTEFVQGEVEQCKTWTRIIRGRQVCLRNTRELLLIFVNMGCLMNLPKKNVLMYLCTLTSHTCVYMLPFKLYVMKGLSERCGDKIFINCIILKHVEMTV